MARQVILVQTPLGDSVGVVAFVLVSPPSATLPLPLGMLVVKSGTDATTTLSLKAGVNTLGRDRLVNDYPIEDSAVSACHLSIHFQDGIFTANDLDSSSGTFVNGQQITSQTLKSDDVIRIGGTEMVFLKLVQNVDSGNTLAAEQAA